MPRMITDQHMLSYVVDRFDIFIYNKARRRFCEKHGGFETGDVVLFSRKFECVYSLTGVVTAFGQYWYAITTIDGEEYCTHRIDIIRKL